MTSIYRKRIWLNKSPALLAYVASQVSVYNDVYYPSIDATVKIADCTNIIELEFNVERSSRTDSWFKEKVAKLDRLIKILTETKEAMIKAKAEIDKVSKKSKKKAKKK